MGGARLPIRDLHPVRIPNCFANPPITPGSQPGTSKTYEPEHMFEDMTQTGTCPTSISPVQMPAFQSSLTGATYCLSQDTMFLLTQSGLDPNFHRKYTGGAQYPINATALDPSVSYLFPYQQGVVINANPDLSYVGLNSTVFYFAYTRLYLFESLPGFTLAYRSPNGEVKIFTVSKDFIDGKVDLSAASVPGDFPAPVSPAAPAPVTPAGQSNATSVPVPVQNATNSTTVPANATAGNFSNAT